MAKQPQAISVSRLNGLVQNAVQRAIPSVWVEGEISDLSRPHSGHIYFSLKDDRSQVRAVIWRSDAERIRHPIRDGMSIICMGDVDVYAARGVYQLIVRRLKPTGIGDLQFKLQQLHARLSDEGLFAPETKRPLPRFPKHIAVVTSPTGAAIHDFLQVIRRRWNGVRVTVAPTRVQGQGAALEIAAAIRAANRMQPSPDVLALIRGGGSLEDLWSFNEEPVVRAVYQSSIPIVSGVGHEIDVTLADLAADVRALTPTEAAERISPSKDDLLQWLDDQASRLTSALRHRARSARARVDALANSPALARPLERIRNQERRLDELAERAQRAANRLLEQQHARVREAAAALDALSPLAVLQRGFSVTRDREGRVVLDGARLAVGDIVTTRFAQGEAVSRIERIQRNEPRDSDGKKESES